MKISATIHFWSAPGMDTEHGVLLVLLVDSDAMISFTRPVRANLETRAQTRHIFTYFKCGAMQVQGIAIT